jgi:hypothetical protein
VFIKGEELDGSVVSALRRAIAKVKQHWSVRNTLSHWSQLHFQPLALTNQHWARVVGYGPISVCVIHKEILCPSIGDINGLMINISLLKNILFYF